MKHKTFWSILVKFDNTAIILWLPTSSRPNLEFSTCQIRLQTAMLNWKFWQREIWERKTRNYGSIENATLEMDGAYNKNGSPQDAKDGGEEGRVGRVKQQRNKKKFSVKKSFKHNHQKNLEQREIFNNFAVYVMTLITKAFPSSFLAALRKRPKFF